LYIVACHVLCQYTCADDRRPRRWHTKKTCSCQKPKNRRQRTKNAL
jgi:hypothetical protein